MSISSRKPQCQNEATTFFEDAHITASLSTRPSTPGDTVIRIKSGPLSDLPKSQFISTLLSTKLAASIVKKATQVQRVALATTANDEIRLIPLHTLAAEWKPALDDQKEYHDSYPGYVSSRSGPKSDNELLEKIQMELTNGQRPAMDTTCIAEGEAASNLFARIIRGEVEQWRVWESESHVAFLTPFANTPGKTVLVPRKHLDSEILALPDGEFRGLLDAVWDVTRMMVREGNCFGAQRVGLIFEGMEINWAHAKLIPIRGDAGQSAGEQPFTEVCWFGFFAAGPGCQSGGARMHVIAICCCCCGVATFVRTITRGSLAAN